MSPPGIEKQVKYGKISQREVELEASLVAPNPKDVEKPATAIPMIELTAPATLMEGYELATQVGDEIVTIVIPPGGVEKGQKFAVPMPVIKAKKESNSSIPVGSWKDGLCDCFRYGLCHASCCLSWWCPLLAAGQVIARLELDWLGRPTSKKSSRASAFSTLAWITAIFYTINMILSSLINSMNVQTTVYNGSGSSSSSNPYGTGTAATLNLINSMMTWSYGLLVFFVLYNVRSQVRSQYGIPESDNCRGGMEDCCCAFWCNKCVAAQMLRHTGDYEHNHAQCCSETGLFVAPHLGTPKEQEHVKHAVATIV